MKKLLSGLGLVGAGALLLLFASPSYRQGERGIAGSKAPEFTFELEGKPATLGAWRGKVVVLNFWATWCPPCVDEMPSLDRLHQQIAPQGGVVFGVSMDDDAAAYEKFLKDHGIRFPNYRDPSKKIAADFGTAKFPETYILIVPPRGGQAIIARKIIGPQSWDRPELLNYVRNLMTRRED